MPRPVRFVQVSLLCGVLAFSLSTIPGVRIHPGFDVVVDGWLQGGCYVLAAMLALLKPFQAGAARRVWIWFGAALAARAAAFVLYFSIIRYLHPTPYPSIADAGWLAMCVLALAGLVQLSRAEFSRLPVSLALDGLMGGARGRRRGCGIPERNTVGAVRGRRGHCQTRHQPGLSDT
jgi:hypothetical protein